MQFEKRFVSTTSTCIHIGICSHFLFVMCNSFFARNAKQEFIKKLFHIKLGENRIGFTRIRDQFACTQERKKERRRHTSLSLFFFLNDDKGRSAITRHEKWEKCGAGGAHRNEIFMVHDISFHAILQPYHEKENFCYDDSDILHFWIK